MIKARSIRVCLHNKIKTVRNINGNSGRNCVRLMSDLANKRFTIVSPDETIALVPTGQILNTVVASSGINHDYLLGFKCDKSNHGAEFSLEHSLQSAVVAYNVSRDVSALDIDGLNVAPVYLCENESRISSNRGVAISSASVKDMESISIKEIFHKYGINTMFRVTQSRSEVNGGESQDRIKVHQLDDSYHGNKGEDFTRDITQPPVSPVMENDTFSPIFQDLSRARQVIEKCSNWMEEAKELMRIFDENVPSTLNLQQLKQEMKFPFVVVEGLDATGKTTLTGKIEQKLSAERYYTPPPHVQALRKRFDDQPEVIRRAYYALGNYIVAVEILKTCQKKAVIMDRYWHSTTAYGIANETSNQDMPEEGHWVYQWPSDLLTPDLVLFLSVSEEIRQKRMMGRGGENTLEEKHLKKDRLFRERLYLAYKRMRNPGCIELDASGSVESVMEAAEAQLDKLKSKM